MQTHAPDRPSSRTLLLYLLAVLCPAMLISGLLLASPPGRAMVAALQQVMHPERSIDDRLLEFGAACRDRLQRWSADAGVPYPSQRVRLVAFKDERVLEIHAARRDGSWTLLTTLPIIGASGTAGPKLRQGDLQVPEGVYAIELLHPGSRFHVALRIGYPSEFDRAMAARDGRKQSGCDLGGDIMIHGGGSSVGCLAMGDDGAELLFTLAHDVGLPGCEVVIAPCDLRSRKPPAVVNGPAWTAELYGTIRSRLAELQHR